MKTLSKESRILIDEFRACGILQDIDQHRLDQRNGAIIVSCADGDQMHDLFHHHEKIIATATTAPRIHTLALNGGALLLPAASPLHQKFHEDLVLLHHLDVARDLKEINTVVLYAHAPCGAAALYNLNFFQVIRYLIEAKNLLKQGDHDIKVACFCHIDYGDGKKRTYFVSREQFDRWRKTNLRARRQD